MDEWKNATLGVHLSSNIITTKKVTTKSFYNLNYKQKNKTKNISVGEITLKSKNPFEYPKIQPNFFSDPEGVKTFSFFLKKKQNLIFFSSSKI